MPQRSPIIFWLLVAATICVDAVAASWLASGETFAAVYAPIVFSALILAQLSVVCIWSATQVTANAWTRIAPVVAAVTAGLLTGSLIRDPTTELGEAIQGTLAAHGLHAALLLTLLWLLQRTTFWQRRTGIYRELRYSVAHLLVAMTVIAILGAFMRDSPLLGDEPVIVIAFICSSVALAVASAFLWIVTWHWLLRLAGTIGFAIALGAVFSPLAAVYAEIEYVWMFSIMISAHYLIEAIVLSIWLGCGPILPSAQRDAET